MIINIEKKHLDILNSILNKYDYGFFLFGSRITNKAKKFSDLDIFYFENIPQKIIINLEEELEDSDLPYKVDLINFNKCDNDFKQIIRNNYICFKSSLKLQIIEQNIQEYLFFLYKKLGFNLHKIFDINLINCEFKLSKFNLAYGTSKDLNNIEQAIIKVKEFFKKQPFTWWISATQHNPKITNSLIDTGFTLQSIKYAMICDLRNANYCKPKTPLLIKNVTNATLLQDFIKVLEIYKNSASNFYKMLNNEHLKSQEKLFVGYLENKPVIIAILFVFKDTAGIFNLFKDNEATRKTHLTDLINYLIHIAKENDCQYVTLYTSGNSNYHIYELLGFEKIAEFECFETSNL